MELPSGILWILGKFWWRFKMVMMMMMMNVSGFALWGCFLFLGLIEEWKLWDRANWQFFQMKFGRYFILVTDSFWKNFKKRNFWENYGEIENENLRVNTWAREKWNFQISNFWSWEGGLTSFFLRFCLLDLTA